jgi:hypothetical protein
MSVLVGVLVLLLQHPILVWYLSRSSVVASWGGWVDLFLFFFFSLSVAAAWSAPPSVGCGYWVCMLSSGSRISSVAHQLSCFGVGFSLCSITGGLFLCLIPFLWGKVSDSLQVPCSQPIKMVCWLFFTFAVLFDFDCCSLAQELSFVVCYLPYFRQGLITRLLWGLLPFQPVFTGSLCGDKLLSPPPFSVAPPTTPSLCCVLIFRSLFTVQLFLFCFVCFVLRGWGSVCPGCYAGLF